MGLGGSSGVRFLVRSMFTLTHGATGSHTPRPLTNASNQNHCCHCGEIVIKFLGMCPECPQPTSGKGIASRPRRPLLLPTTRMVGNYAISRLRIRKERQVT
jgi:hypothetical protein